MMRNVSQQGVSIFYLEKYIPNQKELSKRAIAKPSWLKEHLHLGKKSPKF